MPPKGSKLGTPVKRESSVEKTPEYDEFIKKLAEYHEKRGTTLDPEPKVGMRHIDLKKLYSRVVDEGGYDLVSDTKARPLMWRKLAEEFIGKSPHLAAQAFMVKSAYYKNLAAYEISTHWGKEPPPKEILEDLTAKGGGVMGRTLDNFHRPPTRDESLANGNSSDNEDQDKDKDKDKDEDHADEPGSASAARSTRGLRQAPPQRVLFQPDLNPARLARSHNANAHAHASPSPALVSNTPMTLATYEPRPQLPLSLKPKTTPANNPEHYRLKRKQQQEAQATPLAKKHKGLMLPGTGFIGPNIYVRAQLALQSGLPEEEQYALHHLVKISHERGDKYRFDQFAGLAEALVNKLLQVASLFHDIDWSVSYQDYSDSRTLDAINGTPDLLTKMQAAVPLDMDHEVETAEFRQALGRITEAGLVIRNMVMLDENAQYISRLALLRDYFSMVLNLGPHPALVELQHYALETVEQLTKYYDLDSQDLLYQTLLAQLETNDRGRIVTSLRAISRIGMTFEENKRLEEVPLDIVQRLPDWMMLPDEELRSACLDFLFQYTSIADNVETLVLDADVQNLVRQLSTLLLYNAKQDAPRPKPRAQKPPPPPHDAESTSHVPRLSHELIEQLLVYDEPQRSSRWLRMCFEEDASSEMTQIHLWQAYQGTFMNYAATHGQLIAGDFIKNVSTTFSGASAQVAGSNKYVIRGIKPRNFALDKQERPLVQCHWRLDDPSRDINGIFSNNNNTECGEFFADSRRIFEHILLGHLNVPRKPDVPPAVPEAQPTPQRVAFDFAAADHAKRRRCEWSVCNHAAPSPTTTATRTSLALLARHINTHLPDVGTFADRTRRHNRTPDADDAPTATPTWHRTIVDERNDAAGLPLGAALVLRNIARGIRRMAPTEQQSAAAAAAEADETAEEEPKVDEDGDVVQKKLPASAELMRKIFDPVREGLFFAMAHNATLGNYVAAVIRTIAAGGG